MTIKYSDGRNVEAVLLTRTENTLRVAAEGAEDALEFTNIHGAWVSAECEPVTIEFAWQRRAHKPTITEADCYCSKDLAAKLIHMLFAGDDAEAEIEAPIQASGSFSAASSFVV